ncbi:LysR family transcriptional regulator [Phenylobacterium sp. 20VBR1]|uniref:LysR family transcriptional regulator n=1 Tax=Phenylobacterium glaciei TaxID=2803784 RepID=A0A941HY89_9CAUL|nr:LysR family transcriptional regulator [Phenylobacterium glaciei]MBR7621195.1 LysR family transcriptional regulator [Phenylobacterium glaciei]
MRAGQLKLKIQLLCGDDLAIGPGKADLLEAIDREGSISGGGRAMGMSYRRTWLLVDTMNRCWTTPLVEATPGGGQQKGARLTDAGREVLFAYRTLEAQLLGAADSPALAVLSGLLLADPKPPRQGVSPGTSSAGKSAGRSRKSDP